MDGFDPASVPLSIIAVLISNPFADIGQFLKFPFFNSGNKIYKSECENGCESKIKHSIHPEMDKEMVKKVK